MHAPTTCRTLLTCALALTATVALAEGAWPDKPVKFIVPYTAGGATDIVTRLIAQKLADDTQWTFVVDNRSGGAGNIGLDAVAKSRADGYTIGMGQTANLAINPTLFPKMPYNAAKDFIPVSVVASQPVVLVVQAASPWKSLADLVAAAKARPGDLKQALAGPGTLGHMAGELLARKAGFQVLNVPYKGAAPAVTDLLGGQTDFMLATPQAVLPMIKGGRLRALAVTSAKRLTVLPDVPTVADTYKGFEALDWKAIVVPAGTPPAIVTRLNAAVDKALAKPATISQLLQEGSTPVGGSPASAAKYIQSEQALWGGIVRATGVKPDQ